LKLRLLTLASLLLFAVAVGCSSSDEPELVVPDNYAKFTDQSESFSIHYPNSWDSEVSQLGDLEELVKQAASSKVSDSDTSGIGILFLAGDNTWGEFNPNVNVLIDVAPNDMTGDEYYELSKENSLETLSSWQLHSEQPVTLGGLRTYMQVSSYALSELYPDAIGRFRYVQVSLKNPGAEIVWVITCGFRTSDQSADAFETCKTVVSSSRLSIDAQGEPSVSVIGDNQLDPDYGCEQIDTNATYFEGEPVQILQPDQVFTVDDVAAVGWKKSKELSSETLPGATSVWYGYYNQRDVEVRVYRSQASAICEGKEIADTATGRSGTSSTRTSYSAYGIVGNLILLCEIKIDECQELLESIIGDNQLDPDDGREHIDTDATYSGTYSVVPATSGPHWAGPMTPAGVPSPARWGRYESALPDEVLIHNLEHGGIGLHYDCVGGCDEIVNALDDILPSNPSQYIMSPYPGLPSKIAITAWRRHLYLDEVDVREIIRFIEENQDNAPESFK